MVRLVKTKERKVSVSNMREAHYNGQVLYCNRQN